MRPLATTPAEFDMPTRDLAAMIDVSAVQAFHTESDIRSLAAIATDMGFIAAHALPNFVPLLRDLIPRGGRTMAGGPIGFPSGGAATATKVHEAKWLKAAGADELDMMINVGRLKSGDLVYVRDEIRAVVEALAPIPLKVILELHHLDDNEIRRGAEIIAESGAAFVKTGSGWTPSATTLEKIALIASVVRGRVGIKASGGVRDLRTVAAMIELGVTRFGINTKSAVELVQANAALSGDESPAAPR